MALSPYIGRFAPSPSGPLHFGSLVAALASCLDARAHGGQWLVRMEDIDPPREMPGAADTILRQLESHGLWWDGPVLYQSQRSDAYEAALARLLDSGLAYACCCTRQQVQSMGGIYNGHCAGLELPREGNALRLQVPPDTFLAFEDLFQGPQQQWLDREVGDFVIHRKDGLYAYQLAVSVDDGEQGITHVIRGSDLLDSTTRQLFVLDQLGLARPCYGHVPVALNAEGQKLSKQNRALSLANQLPGHNMERALDWLGLLLPGELRGAPVAELLAWGQAHWRRERVPRIMGQPAPPGY